jgi:putative transposase
VLVTDYGVARRRVMPAVEHRQSKYLNNRAENSHQPTRQRERAMKKFRSPGGAAVPVGVQRDITALSPRRHRLTAAQYRREMTTRFSTWDEVVGLPAAT